MKFTHTLLALALAGAAPSAFAQSTDLSVTGSILPGACTVELGGGGIAFLGNMSAQDLNADAPTELEPVKVPVSVACEAAARFSFRAIDHVPWPDVHFYSLGMTPAEEPIGTAILRLVDGVLDTGIGYGTVRTDGSDNWTPALNTTGMELQQNTVRGFAAEEHVTTGPAMTRTLQANLQVDASIFPTDELTLTEDVAINGNVTLSLVYL